MALNHPTAEFPDEILHRERVAVWMVRLEGDEEAFATVKDVGSVGSSSKSCVKTSVLDIGGTFYTDESGTAEFLLSDSWCNKWFDFAGTLTFEYPVIFVATPQSNAPVFLTSLQVVVAHEPRPLPGPVNDIKVTVFSWNANGSPRGNVSFDWRCSVAMSWDSALDKPAPRSQGHHSEPSSYTQCAS